MFAGVEVQGENMFAAETEIDNCLNRLRIMDEFGRYFEIGGLA